MENLARYEYETDADKKVKEELETANIPVMELPYYMNTEVKTRYIGMLNGFVFTRAWTYWVSNGDMPLEIANIIYAKYKDLSIRAGGHAGNESPISQSYNPVYTKELDYFFKTSQIENISERIKAAEKIVDDKSLPRFVGFYHIDTQLGLVKLANTIREYNVVSENKLIKS